MKPAAMSTVCLNLALSFCLAPVIWFLSLCEVIGFQDAVDHVKSFIVLALRPDLENEVYDKKRPTTRQLVHYVLSDLHEIKAATRTVPELHELLRKSDEREGQVKDLLKKGWSREDMMVGALAQTKERLKREIYQTRRQGKKVDELLTRLDSSTSAESLYVDSGPPTPVSRASSHTL